MYVSRSITVDMYTCVPNYLSPIYQQATAAQEEFNKKGSMDPVSHARCHTDSYTKVHKIMNRCSVRHPGRNSLLNPFVRIFRVLSKIM